MKFQINNRFTGAVQFECKLSTEIAKKSYSIRLGFAVKEAVKSGANLSGADLSNANLSGANLSGADLKSANLIGADLKSADLSNAYLSGAYLSGANLSGADLKSADLSNANLSGANLSGADLSNANLSGANLSGADLKSANLIGANLNSFKQDLIAEVLRMPNELEALRDAIISGKIDGSTYKGECACLAGTLAKAHGDLQYKGNDIDLGKIVFHAHASSPREIWFTMIKVKDNPDTNQAAKIALEWVDEAIAIRDNIRLTMGA